ncbi:MAG: hypothetical protein COZ06_23840 [Armatimonadetes bacterium CG_4_10_14_3_um_filter_66_18]|nr:acetylxylan esterase [Armatimonadota bacterium]OIP11374.1 MAG: hypothetical protein AUJ96_02450 [Armatimonadetes bacterium CG2_30_66_41]PIU92516.1 MAG: hypothetical protein COS65_17500 [Armatimonadetes bacterium CG06_land_8_20_14_3_00_66_21]PIW21166.1 MAG: hypothetical protein COW34_00020 [Armatimonadetes bacterium CG17_big_fil_post_rev_8_21_14_2_50_66_6]PIX39497.1 MAG: hypothetical protein COZ57_28145 [Armatimonadetes bacterium CG_4_8_14_3_um_filter_66_20]PIY42970.1 MAG: hypothetical prote
MNYNGSFAAGCRSARPLLDVRPLPELAPARIMVAGGSQGGGLLMVLAGLDKRVAFAAPAHSGLCRLDWTVLHKPGFWPFGMETPPAG